MFWNHLGTFFKPKTKAECVLEASGIVLNVSGVLLLDPVEMNNNV